MKDSASHSTPGSDLEKRSEARRSRIIAHRAHSFQEADEWDLAYWQAQGPEARLSALMALREDLLKVEASRELR